ncbi:MAG: restriction endonuclease subunit S [Rhodospirillales bacterium]|nr:restriction endonuclease subunit S [Rhodospirillales bacterium]MBR9817324.1 restriction endonuclease subunit S [Rhodospirillales bacterium]
MNIWPTVTLGSLLEKVASIDPRKTPDEEFTYVDVSSVSRRTFSIEETSRLKGADAPSRARRHIKKGDILFATIRPTLQRIAVVPDDLDGQVCSTGYIVLRPKLSLDNKFLFYFLFTEGFSSEMEARQKGASYPAVNDSDVKEQLISLPPLPEQKRIVAILDEAFEGIDAAIVNTQANLAAARELFESYLERAFAENQQGTTTLDNLAASITDGDHAAPPKSEVGLPFITISNIDKTTHQIDFNGSFKVPKTYVENLKENRKPRFGDVLYTVTGSFGIPVHVDFDEPFCFQRHIGLIRPNPNVDSRWMYFLLRTPAIFRQASQLATGTAQKTVSLRALRSFEVPVMDKATQAIVVSRVDRVLSYNFRLETGYQQKLNALHELKQSILAKAFRGELTPEEIAA